MKVVACCTTVPELLIPTKVVWFAACVGVIAVKPVQETSVIVGLAGAVKTSMTKPFPSSISNLVVSTLALTIPPSIIPVVNKCANDTKVFILFTVISATPVIWFK